MRTLHDARAYCIKLPKVDASHPVWQRVAELLMVAADAQGREQRTAAIEAATRQVELALLMTARADYA